jgi:hypothetical protein
MEAMFLRNVGWLLKCSYVTRSLQLTVAICYYQGTIRPNCNGCFNTVTCRLVAGQRLGKHIPAATNMQAKVGQLPLLCNAL